MIDLSDIEKGNFRLPIDRDQTLLEILRLSVSNQAMINALINTLINESSLFDETDKDKFAVKIREQYDSRFNEMWAEFYNVVVVKDSNKREPYK